MDNFDKIAGEFGVEEWTGPGLGHTGHTQFFLLDVWSALLLKHTRKQALVLIVNKQRSTHYFWQRVFDLTVKVG